MNIIDMHFLVPTPFPTNSVENGDQGLKKKSAQAAAVKKSGPIEMSRDKGTEGTTSEGKGETVESSRVGDEISG